MFPLNSNLNRREVLKLLVAGSAALSLPDVAQAKRAPDLAKNVLFLIADDLNFWVNCLGGHEGVQTPHIDRLAGRGMLFRNAHCAAPVCNPARTAILTGLRPSTTGVYLNTQNFRSVVPDCVTLPMHFRAHGYHVAGAGKVFHIPDPRSWPEYWPSRADTTPIDPQPVDRSPGVTAIDHELRFGPLDCKPEQMGDVLVARWAAEKLKQPQKRPFFFAAGFRKPHLPWFVPREYFDLYPLEKITLPKVNERDLDDVPSLGRHWALTRDHHRKIVETHEWKRAVQAYLASITFVDAQIGTVLDALDAGPHKDNTIVVLCTDHGWHLGPKLHWQKCTLWEEATRVPLIVIAPGITQPGQECARPVNSNDLYPTLIELCGLAERPGLEGVSLAPLLRDPAAGRERPALTNYRRGNYAVRDEHWRYIRYNDGTEELYDKDRDALEWSNLASDSKFADIKKQLGKWIPAHHAPDAPHQKVPEDRWEKSENEV